MAADETPKRRWNWTKTILVLSLGANLIVAGMVVGAVVGDRHRPDRGGSGFTVGMRPYIAALPESRRGEVRGYLERHRDADRQSRQKMREVSGNIRDAMGHMPFDPEQLRRAFAEQRNLYDGFAASGHEAIVEILADMTDAERAEFIENLANSRRNGGHRPERN